MITLDLWQLTHPAAPGAASQGTLAQCEEWRERDPMRTGGEGYVIELVPACGCCGATYADVRDRRGSICSWGKIEPITRCDRHHDRNPCAIEGCKRTRSAPARDDGLGHHLADDQWLCAEHWRRYVPPRSRVRRAYHAHFRRAKRLGWDAERERAFWRFWNQLVLMARRRATEGHIDESEIRRIMGWD